MPLIGNAIVALPCCRRRRQCLSFLRGAADCRRRDRRRGIQHRRGCRTDVSRCRTVVVGRCRDDPELGAFVCFGRCVGYACGPGDIGVVRAAICGYLPLIRNVIVALSRRCRRGQCLAFSRGSPDRRGRDRRCCVQNRRGCRTDGRGRRTIVVGRRRDDPELGAFVCFGCCVGYACGPGDIGVVRAAIRRYLPLIRNVIVALPRRCRRSQGLSFLRGAADCRCRDRRRRVQYRRCR